MNKGVFVDYIPIICQNLYNYDHHFCGQGNWKTVTLKEKS